MANKRILICDDDEGILDVLELILEETGHTIIPEINSLNLWTMIEQNPPDLIIIDLWMPVLSGDQIIQMVRRHPNYMNIPIIAISASRDGEKIALDSGADKFIAKPFDHDHLIQVTKSILD